MSQGENGRRQYRHLAAFPAGLSDGQIQKAETSSERRLPIGACRCTSQTRAWCLPQPANWIGRESHDLSEVAYVLTDDEQLGVEITSIVEANGIRAKWFRSTLSYLAYKRPEVASCLLISRGLSGLQRLLASSVTPPLIVLSGNGDIPSCVRAIKNGAHDFLTLPLMTSQLLDAMNSALQKDGAALAMRQEHEDLRNRWRSLTSRETEVMRYVVGGFLNKQTAAELRITENTVQVHRGRVMRKMQADSFAALVRMSLKLADSEDDSFLYRQTA